MTSRNTGIFLEDLSELTSLRILKALEEALYPPRRDGREEENPSPVRRIIGKGGSEEKVCVGAKPSLTNGDKGVRKNEE